MKKKELIFSNNFASHSDLIYSQTISYTEFKKTYSNEKNIEVVNYTKNPLFDAITYKLKYFNLTENCIIYTNSDLIENLFNHLRNVNFRNIILITNQSDRAINKSVFLKRPHCISKWYAINVNYIDKDLIPIPLGLSNNISKKNLTESSFSEMEYNFNSQKINKLYINFNENTNYKERTWIKDYFSNKEFAYIENSILDLREYQEKLTNYRFVLCPFGNGFDSHRIWETLYSGSIPVVMNHPTFNCLNDLPVIMVDDFKNITEQYLLNRLEDLRYQDLDFKKLELDWWIDNIRKNKIEQTSENILIDSNTMYQKLFLLKLTCKQKTHSLLKKLIYNLRRIKKLKKYVTK